MIAPNKMALNREKPEMAILTGLKKGMFHCGMTPNSRKNLENPTSHSAPLSPGLCRSVS
jgi:hypothetical protein